MGKAIDSKRRYVIRALAGRSRFRWWLELKRRFYFWLVSGMSEGEVLDHYYRLTNREEADYE